MIVETLHQPDDRKQQRQQSEREKRCVVVDQFPIAKVVYKVSTISTPHLCSSSTRKQERKTKVTTPISSLTIVRLHSRQTNKIMYKAASPEM